MNIEKIINYAEDHGFILKSNQFNTIDRIYVENFYNKDGEYILGITKNGKLIPIIYNLGDYDFENEEVGVDILKTEYVTFVSYILNYIDETFNFYDDYDISLIDFKHNEALRFPRDVTEEIY